MDYTKIIYTVIALLCAVADAFFIPWLKTKIDAEQLKKVLDYVKIAVEAAEKLFINEENAGAKKKAYVKDFLATKGIKYDEATIDAAIESAVIQMEYSLLNEK